MKAANKSFRLDQLKVYLRGFGNSIKQTINLFFMNAFSTYFALANFLKMVRDRVDKEHLNFSVFFRKEDFWLKTCLLNHHLEYSALVCSRNKKFETTNRH